MRNFGMLLGSIALAMVLLGGSNASAQVLDNVWFKLNVSAKGYAVGTDDSVTKTSFKATAWMLVQQTGPDQYTYYIFSETAPDTWEQTSTGSFSATPSGDEYFFQADNDLTVETPDGAEIISYFTGVIKVKLDSLGNLKSATFQTLGAEVYDGSTPDGATIYGGAKVKGKTSEYPGFPV